MNKPLFTNTTYLVLFSLLGVVYFIGLFVPLMNSDSGHHAVIALHMHLTGDYVSLIDREQPYLDKPHLLFWLAALGYKVFGVTSFAYKLPSFLFTVLGTYSVYRLGKALYDNETGKLAALIAASAFGYILANNDVRMDAILTASVAFATWQLVAFIQHKKITSVAGAALGLALGFATKGHIAVFTAGVATLFYIAYLKEWRILLNPKWLLLILFFSLFISPVVYCYYLQFNLHPETTVRGKNNIDGVAFILWGQSIERFSGDMGKVGSNDYLFFIHSFLWAFAPWSVITFISFFNRIKNFLDRKQEWATTGLFAVMLLIISFSKFKLPHYLNIVFPTAAVMTAAYLFYHHKATRKLFVVQLVVAALMVLGALVLNTWIFPVGSVPVIIGSLLLLAAIFYCLRTTSFSALQKLVLNSTLVSVFVFLLLNGNFYPKLLSYQGGNQLAFENGGRVNPDEVYFWEFTKDYSWYFYTASLPKKFDAAVLNTKDKVWILSDSSEIKNIKASGLEIGQQYSATSYHVTRLTGTFLNPATREQATSQLVLSQVFRKQ